MNINIIYLIEFILNNKQNKIKNEKLYNISKIYTKSKSLSYL